jgi:hypothetical protein
MSGIIIPEKNLGGWYEAWFVSNNDIDRHPEFEHGCLWRRGADVW